MLRKMEPEPIANNYDECFVCGRPFEEKGFDYLMRGGIVRCSICGARHEMQAGCNIAVIGVKV